MVKAFSEASVKDIEYKIVDRRLGNVTMRYEDLTKDNNELG